MFTIHNTNGTREREKLLQEKSTCLISGAQLGEGGLPCLFENLKKCPDFGKKGPDCLHLWLKFSIQNVALRVLRKKIIQNFSLQGFLFLFLTKCLSKSPNSTKPPMPYKISGCAPGFFCSSAFPTLC